MAGLGWTDIGLHVALALAALGVTFVFFWFGWIGGGDAKLFAATCLWLGPAAMLTYSIYAALLGGGLTLLLLAWRGLPLPVTADLSRLAGAPAQSKRGRTLRDCPGRGRVARLSATPRSWPRSAPEPFLSFDF